MELIFSDKFKSAMVKTVQGYHMVNDMPIKEATWESVLHCALSGVGCEHEWKNGGHQSGWDIKVGTIGISCKSCKKEKDNLKISSYRMTTCSTIQEFITEIDETRANFEYYSVLARTETTDDITYSAYMIPSNVIKAKNHEWQEHRKKDKVTRWTSNIVDGVKMSISTSMSNQLWIDVREACIKEYCVLYNVKVSKRKHMDYITLFDKLSCVPDPSLDSPTPLPEDSGTSPNRDSQTLT